MIEKCIIKGTQFTFSVLITNSSHPPCVSFLSATSAVFHQHKQIFQPHSLLANFDLGGRVELRRLLLGWRTIDILPHISSIME